jgi:rRNA maturation endonuclease Nob1
MSEQVKYTFLCAECGAEFDSANKKPFCPYCGGNDFIELGTVKVVTK